MHLTKLHGLLSSMTHKYGDEGFTEAEAWIIEQIKFEEPIQATDQHNKFNVHEVLSLALNKKCCKIAEKILIAVDHLRSLPRHIHIDVKDEDINRAFNHDDPLRLRCITLLRSIRVKQAQASSSRKDFSVSSYKKTFIQDLQTGAEWPTALKCIIEIETGLASVNLSKIIALYKCGKAQVDFLDRIFDSDKPLSTIKGCLERRFAKALDHPSSHLCTGLYYILVQWKKTRTVESGGANTHKKIDYYITQLLSTMKSQKSCAMKNIDANIEALEKKLEEGPYQSWDKSKWEEFLYNRYKQINAIYPTAPRPTQPPVYASGAVLPRRAPLNTYPLVPAAAQLSAPAPRPAKLPVHASGAVQTSRAPLNTYPLVPAAAQLSAAAPGSAKPPVHASGAVQPSRAPLNAHTLVPAAAQSSAAVPIPAKPPVHAASLLSSPVSIAAVDPSSYEEPWLTSYELPSQPEAVDACDHYERYDVSDSESSSLYGHYSDLDEPCLTYELPSQPEAVDACDHYELYDVSDSVLEEVDPCNPYDDPYKELGEIDQYRYVRRHNQISYRSRTFDPEDTRNFGKRARLESSTNLPPVGNFTAREEAKRGDGSRQSNNPLPRYSL